MVSKEEVVTKEEKEAVTLDSKLNTWSLLYFGWLYLFDIENSAIDRLVNKSHQVYKQVHFYSLPRTYYQSR